MKVFAAKHRNLARSSPQLVCIADKILTHHEWWDGSGYPLGLQGENIPLLSRIIAILDAFEVMTSGRPYKNRYSQKDALVELKICSGTHFDPKLIELFIKTAPYLQKLPDDETTLSNTANI